MYRDFNQVAFLFVAYLFILKKVFLVPFPMVSPIKRMHAYGGNYCVLLVLGPDLFTFVYQVVLRPTKGGAADYCRSAQSAIRQSFLLQVTRRLHPLNSLPKLHP